ncbi:Rhs element Vgr protein [Pseudomonas sp. ok272]|nr:Rhs element Vgr protein [Pseudomonas sp. ok272]SFM78115.1 Rhs element Vgr protein [Pseudomonas sp. ok602]
MPANQSRFTLTLEGAQDQLKVLGFTGRETISQPYRFDLELVSDRPDLDLDALLHRQAFLGFGDAGAGVHGQVYRVAQGDSGHRQTHYHLSLVPRLAYLSGQIDQRIFQGLSVPQIIEQVLKRHGILGDAFALRLARKYPVREYCVQYAESDLAFIQRLCAEIGIHYHFQHRADGHLLVFGDDQAVFPRLAQPTLYLPDSTLAPEPTIKRLQVRLETRTSAVALRDYDFEKPGIMLHSAVEGERQPRLEDFHYPGQFTDRDRGWSLAQLALERHGADFCQAEGASDQPALAAGYVLSLAEHPRQAWNAPWLITTVEHHGRQPQVLEETADSEGFQGYRNTFLATPFDIPFRPPLFEHRPRAVGYQHAVVKGRPGSEIDCDPYGRVRVQFVWDRQAKPDEASSCWLRVASGWAHDGYGTVLIPRVGMEVLVGFVDGDPDKPLIMGCLPNGENRTPLDLPASQTRSIFRSQSSPGGGGYNEVRIEDRKGAEEIYLRAERNWTQHVRNDLHVQVDHQRSVLVTGLDQHELKDEEHRLTHGHRRTELRQDDHLQVSGDRHIRVRSQSSHASQRIQLSAGQQVVIDGGTHATIQAGGNWISISAAGIFSSTPIQVGGSAMPLRRAAPAMPGLPEAMATSEPATLGPAQLLNLQSAAPFCEECERCKDGLCATPSPTTPTGTAKTSASTDIEPGFHLVSHAMPRAAMESLLFEQASPEVLAKFRQLNPHLGNYAKPGQLLVLSDPRNTQCTREEALLMEAALKVDAALEPLTDAEAEFMARHHDEIESFLMQGSTSIGIGAAMFGEHLSKLSTTLKQIEDLHIHTFNTHGALKGDDFLKQRAALLKQLDSSLGPLVRKGVGIPEHQKLKHALGISTKSLVHHWKKAGTAGGMPGYATHIDGVSKASKVIKLGGWVGIGMGAAGSGLKVKETCRVGTEEACRKVKFTEVGKFGGGATLGSLGGWAGLGVCVGIGVGTAGVGGAVCALVLVGAGTYVGGEAGAALGDKLGEIVYETIYQ